MITRDILGNEQVLTQPFYVTPRLLKQGLHDYSYELGFERRNFGAESNNYGRPVAIGTHRYGITDQFTGEVHAELLGHQQAVGLGGVLLSPAIGVFSGSFAIEPQQKGSGWITEAWNSRPEWKFKFAANTQLTSQRFTKLGMLPEEIAPRQISNMFINLGLQNMALSHWTTGCMPIETGKWKKELAASYTRK